MDHLFSKKYNEDFYNCAHFAVDVWRELYGDAMSKTLACFLLPENERFADPLIRKSFSMVSKKDPQIGDIVVLHRTVGNAHVAICVDGGFIHLNERGVFVVSWRILHLGFIRSKVYRHAKNNGLRL